MLPGYNHNIRHKGVLFHVQTEDGGDGNPSVVTTIFYRGNVIANRRTSYAKFANLKERNEIVSSIMKDQHKEMMKKLVQDEIRSALSIIEREIRQATPAETSVPKVPPPHASKQPPMRTLDVDEKVDKTLDELILEFLNQEAKSKP